MTLEIYKEKYFEIFDPQNARQVAMFFDKADAEAYLEWRNGGEHPVSEAEWLGNIRGGVAGQRPSVDERWLEKDKILEDVWTELDRLRGIDGRNPMVDDAQLFVNSYRIRLGVEHGRLAPEMARELLGVPEWAR